ncbi:hypothetical protein N7451_005101 [Penicillium sp. IBT 35674x]|nr:hypothetical protein N7451_005101 [Penicillium sp. IBT 35674x]
MTFQVEWGDQLSKEPTVMLARRVESPPSAAIISLRLHTASNPSSTVSRSLSGAMQVVDHPDW